MIVILLFSQKEREEYGGCFFVVAKNTCKREAKKWREMFFVGGGLQSSVGVEANVVWP